MVHFDRAYGALLGVFVGDAAGAPLEFYHKSLTDEIVQNAMHMPGGGSLEVGPGQITDDGELTLSLAHALCGKNPEHGLPLEDIAKNYVKWMHSAPFDVGNTCMQAFQVANKNMQYPGMENVSLHAYMMQNVIDANKSMESNGSLMRIMPMAIWSAEQSTLVIAHNGRMDAMLSHPNRVCQDCNALYCIAVAHLLNHKNDADGAIKAVENFMEENEIHQKVKDWFNQSVSIAELNCKTCIGHVKYAFWLTFYFLRNKMSFADAIHATLMKGGDTDTNAAIVGGMMGALHGFDAIPSYMRDPVESFDCTNAEHAFHVRDKFYSAKFTKEVVEKLLQY